MSDSDDERSDDESRRLIPFTQLSSEVCAINPWWEYRVDTYRQPDGGIGEYHYARTGGSVLVIPLRDDGRIVMVRQYRYLDGCVGLEFPGGGIGAHGDAEAAARAELAEEAGLAARRLERIGRFNPCKGLVQEICEVFAAIGLSEVSRGEGDPTELVEPVAMTQDELEAAVRAGDVLDGMTLAALALLDRIPE